MNHQVARLPYGFCACIRPEHLRVDPRGSGFRLDLIEKPGAVSFAYLHAKTGERLIVAEDGEPDLSDDMDVGIAFERARLSV